MPMPTKARAPRVEVLLENTRILFRNFAGAKKKFNDAGKRNFAVVLTEEQYTRMGRDGWLVKQRPPREEGDDPLYFLKVHVTFGAYPPRIVLIAGGSQTELDEQAVSMLDLAEITNVDLKIRAYDRVDPDDGTVQRSAYLSAIYVTINEDPLERKYRELASEGDAEGDSDVEARF